VCGIAMPADWRERVKIGSDRKQSSTARENLKPSPVQLPDELPELHKQLVDYAAPGLRKLLGYSLR
jgi:isopenicillin N synthase-like dioxygenase